VPKPPVSKLRLITPFWIWCCELIKAYIFASTIRKFSFFSFRSILTIKIEVRLPISTSPCGADPSPMTKVLETIFEKIRVKQLSVFGWKLIVGSFSPFLTELSSFVTFSVLSLCGHQSPLNCFSLGLALVDYGFPYKL
jgi:hypothetical protein